MSRILLVLVLALGAVLIVPPLRERAQPQIEWALTPVYRWQTKNRVNELRRVLAREHSQGASLPRPRDFHTFLSQREGAEAALDTWGQPFYLEVTRQGFRIGSPGPDRVQGTPDDIYSTFAAF
jgi:hypothetical protein